MSGSRRKAIRDLLAVKLGQSPTKTEMKAAKRAWVRGR